MSARRTPGDPAGRAGFDVCETRPGDPAGRAGFDVCKAHPGDPAGSYEESYTVYYSMMHHIGCMDVDVNNNIKPTELIKCIQETANGQMNARKPSYFELFWDRKAFIISRFSMEIYEQIHQFDDIETRTWTAGTRGVTFFRGYEVIRGGRCVAKASGDWAVVDTEDGHLYKTKEIDFSNYESGEKPDLSISEKFRIPRDLQMEGCGVHHVELSECDMNMHMNNTQYANVLWNRIDGILGKELTSFSIRFRAEAKFGSDIMMMRSVQPGRGGAPEHQNPDQAGSEQGGASGAAEQNLPGLIIPNYGDRAADELAVFRTETEGRTNVEAVFGLRSIR